MSEETLLWSKLRDRHCETTTSRGKIWIRLNRQDQVIGIYTGFGQIRKWIPEETDSLTLEDGKVQAEFLLAAHVAAEKLAENNCEKVFRSQEKELYLLNKNQST